MPKKSSKSTSSSNTPDTTLAKDGHVFFWKIHAANGWASQWYHSPFTARIQMRVGLRFIDSEAEHTYPTAEHWMMGCKALLFGDRAVFAKVVTAGESDMRYVKGLGREVKEFDEKLWKEWRERVVVKGNEHKFRQNEELRSLLLETGDKVIVEASPMDRIWGIGFGEKRALEVKGRWGLNLLGKALMEVRKELKKEQEEARDNAIAEGNAET